jgi:hypothetical protein
VRELRTDRRAGAIVVALTVLAALVCLSLRPAGAGAVKSVPESFFGTVAVAPTEQDFNKMGRGHIGSYRVILGWRSIQKRRKSPYSWHGADTTMTRLAENGIRPVPVLVGTPRFIAKKDDKIVPPTRSKRDRREWTDFVHAAVARYGPDGAFWAQNPGLGGEPARDWMVWNEQNARPFWRPRPDPREYAQLLKISARAIKAEDSGATVITGGMFGEPQDRRSLSAKAFLKRLYRIKAARGRIDAVSVHPYSGGLGGVKRQIETARKIMNSHGGRKAKIQVGEFGWSTGGPKNNPLVKSKKGQARLIKRAAKLFADKRRSWGLESAFVYLFRDLPEPIACQWCQKAGMLTNKGNAKPSWRAYKRVISASR